MLCAPFAAGCAPLVLLFAALLLAGCQQNAFKSNEFDPLEIFSSADNRRYRLERVEKKPGNHSWIDKTTLRYYPHAIYEVAREDDSFFYVKQYLPVTVTPVTAGRPPEARSLPVSEHFVWRAYDQGLPRGQQWRDNFAIADMNGDGHADLVFPPPRKTLAAPVIFLGDGDGTWARWTKAKFPAIAFDYGGAAVSDFNGDRKQGIALGMHLLGVAALLGDGQGGFTNLSDGLPVQQRGARPPLSSRKLVALDWDGDGRKDIIVLNERIGADRATTFRDGVIVFLNREGSWAVSPSEEPLRDARLMAIDKTATRLVVTSDSIRSGTLVLQERIAGRWVKHEVSGFPADVQVTALAVADPTNDGASTFVVAYQSRFQSTWWSHIDVLRKRDGQWIRVQLAAARSSAEIRGLAFGKFRPGASLDVIALDDQGQLDVFRHSDGETYTRDSSYPVPAWRAGCQGYGLQTGDLDRDGLDEIVASFAGEGTALSKTIDCASGGAIQAFKLVAR